ncbi:MAG: peptidoglycan DD-metalloendopeptidase family protein [Mycobacteriales bacterium]
MVRRVLVLVLLVLVALVGLPAERAVADAGPWGWPLSGPREVVRGFEPPATRYGAGHRGVDLPSAPGAAVLAAAAGQVSYAGLLAGRGVVVVTHGTLRTTYEPVTAAVRPGAVVALGQPVGQLEPGHAGCTVAACLHWGLRRGEQYLDPVRLVERGPVRLLPLDRMTAGSAWAPHAPAFPGAGMPGAAVPGGGMPGAGMPGAGMPGAEVPGGAVRAAAGPVRATTAPPPAAAVLHEPSWSLRADEAPLAAAALVALALGIALLARPVPDPPEPASGAAAAPAPAAPAEDDEQVALPAPLLDLDAARLRRHAS